MAGSPRACIGATDGLLAEQGVGGGNADPGMAYIMRLTRGRGRGVPPHSTRDTASACASPAPAATAYASPAPPGSRFAGALAGYCSDDEDPFWGPHWDNRGLPLDGPPHVPEPTGRLAWSQQARDAEQFRRHHARYAGGRWVTYGPQREIYIRAAEGPGAHARWVLVWGPRGPPDPNVRGPHRGELDTTAGGFHG